LATKHALIVQGGWPGHKPLECAELFGGLLRAKGLEVQIADSLGVLTDEQLMSRMDLIVPMWTMGELKHEEQTGMLNAVHRGAGFAGFHGGMGDAFRMNTLYQFAVGGQFVAHPGDHLPLHGYEIVDRHHPITQGVGNFSIPDTEQYYLHVDPSNHVLVTTTFSNGVVMPAAWTRSWGSGRVFYASWGHAPKDFDVPEAREIVLRGLLWACGAKTA
jgi:type 1 glutamine amidotransferase